MKFFEERRQSKIYCLTSSRDGVVRYVGQCERSFENRLLGHLNYARKGATLKVCKWINEERKSGHVILMQPLIVGMTKEEARRFERELIQTWPTDFLLNEVHRKNTGNPHWRPQK